MRKIMSFIFKRLVIAFVAVLVLSASPAGATDLENEFEVGGDLGFHLNDVDMFGASLLAEYHVTPNVAFGPLMQIGAEDRFFLFGTTGMAKYKINTPESDRLKPYGQVGIGFLIVQEEIRTSYRDPVTGQKKTETKTESDTDFLIPIGGGFEYWVLEDWAFGSNFLFNISEDTLFSLYFGLRVKF